MWNDIETTVDYLHFSVVADTVAELIEESNGNPISIGVSGNWGVGKSSMVKMIGAALQKNDEVNAENEKNYVFLDFNAWLYQGYDDARTALLQAVSDKLNEEVAKRKPNPEVSNKVAEFTKRINWLQMAKLILPLAIGLIPGAAPVGAISSLIGAVTTSIGNKKKTEENGEAINTAIEDVLPEIQGLLKEKSVKSMPQQIEELRKDFEESLKDLNITLVVLVDDLDRCLPTTAISTLEAMRLLLFVPRTAFIIAADEQMIRNGVKAHFSDIELSEGLVTSYFDKLIQIPLTVPHLGVPEIKVYIILLFAEKALRKNKISEEAFNSAKNNLQTLLCNAWQGGLTKAKIKDAFDSDTLNVMQEFIEMADQLSGLLVSADKIKGNPRLIKRFLNALEIREKVARLNGITVDYNCLVKMLLFERCASAGAFEYLLKKAAESSDGKLEFIREIEDMLAVGNDYIAPDITWKSEFIEEWLKLDPKIGEYDIRPLLYLSQDRSLSIAAYDELSLTAQNILSALENIKTGTLMSELIERIKEIGETEADIVLNRIIRLGRTSQWEVNTLHAALHITEAFPALGSKLALALGEIPAKSRKTTYIPALRGKPWALEMLHQWKESKDTPTNVKKAIELQEGK